MSNPRVLLAVDAPDLRRRVVAALEANGLARADPGGDADVAVLATAGRADGGAPQLPELPDDTPAVVLVGEHSNRVVRRALRDGAHGVVLEEEVEHALGPCVVAVLAGQLCLPRRLHREAVKPTLTVREKQILGMIVLGMTNGQIAAQLHVTESTVKSHASATFSKLGVSSRSEAAAAVLDPEEGLGTGILSIVDDG